MHEWNLVRALVRNIEHAAQRQGAAKVVAVKVRIGALAAISPDVLRQQFAVAALGSVAEGACLEIDMSSAEESTADNGLFIESLAIE